MKNISINWKNAIIGGIVGTLLFDLLGLALTGTWWDIPNLIGSKVGLGGIWITSIGVKEKPSTGEGEQL